MTTLQNLDWLRLAVQAVLKYSKHLLVVKWLKDAHLFMTETLSVPVLASHFTP
jgi:hypothetical protein